MDYVTLVNRSSRTLSGTWDGRRYELAPGKSSHPQAVAEAIKRQNPILGSDDPVTGELQYLFGIEENGDATTPIEQSDEIELYNRRQAKNAIPIMVVPGNVGMYSLKRTDIAAAPLPQDSTFVKP